MASRFSICFSISFFFLVVWSWDPFNLPRWHDSCVHVSMSLNGIVVKTYDCFYYFNFSVLDVNWLFVLYLYGSVVLKFFFSFLSFSSKWKIVPLWSFFSVYLFARIHTHTCAHTSIHKIEWSMKFSASLNACHCFMSNVDIWSDKE